MQNVFLRIVHAACRCLCIRRCGGPCGFDRLGLLPDKSMTSQDLRRNDLRRQRINEEAYVAVLKAVMLRSLNQDSDMRTRMLLAKLRSELAIPNEQHSALMRFFLDHKATGALEPLLLSDAPFPLPKGLLSAPPPAIPPTALPPTADVAGHGSQGGPSLGSAHPRGAAGRGSGQWAEAGSEVEGSSPEGTPPGGQGHGVGLGPRRGSQQLQQLQAAEEGGAGGAAARLESSALPALIGAKVQRYWPKEGQWFVGVVTDYRPRDNKYCITYDVGTKNESMEWYDIMAAEAVGDPQRSHYQLTTEKVDLRRFTSTRAFQNSSVLNPKSKKAGGGPGNQAAKLSPSCSADLSVGALTPTSRTGAPKKHKLMSALMV
ncbi:hypothetical protein V8C86DRAFT_1094877 [Haematococcus lacustris]